MNIKQKPNKALTKTSSYINKNITFLKLKIYLKENNNDKKSIKNHFLREMVKVIKTILNLEIIWGIMPPHVQIIESVWYGKTWSLFYFVFNF